jgi:hypothetical protein
MATKCTKRTLNIQFGCKIDQLAIKNANIFHCKTLQNLPKLVFFGLKIYHLARLLSLRIAGLGRLPAQLLFPPGRIR